MASSSVVESGFSSKKNETGHDVYTFRWTILAMFCFLEMGNALLWVTFAPISDVTSNYFGGNYYGSTTSVNMLANIFLILYGPGTILATLSMKYYKLRMTLIIAGTLTLSGALLRYIAALCSDQLGNGNTYILMLIGQSLAAICQPMFLNLPPAIASIWFPVNERDMATTIGSMCSPIGNAIGQIIPVLLVSQSSINGSDDNYSVHGMADLMLVEFIICIVPLALAVVLFRDAPPTPPSQSTQLKIESSSKKNTIAGESDQVAVAQGYQEAWAVFCVEAGQLFRNKDYLLLFAAFSIGVGFFNSLLTLLNQIVAPFGYSNDDAGTFGAVFIVFGLVGAGSIGTLMEKTKAYRPILKGGILLSFSSILLFLAMLFSDNFWPLLVTFAIMGFCILPLLPVMMENCAECTYPIPEELSMGILFVGANILGLGFIFALQFLLEAKRLGPPPLLPSNIFILLIMAVALIILQFYHGEYKRHKQEGASHSQPLLRDDELGNQQTSAFNGNFGADEGRDMGTTSPLSSFQ